MSILILIYIISAILCFFVILKNNEKDPGEKVSLGMGLLWCVVPILNVVVICVGLFNLHILSYENHESPNIFTKANNWFKNGGML